jgi:dephospho-CoA kinase
MKKIGITGGIGSGKSIISQTLRIMGYSVYDSDSWAKTLMNSNEEIKKKLISKFGKETYNSKGLNKSHLAQHIFNNNEALIHVNSIVHPIVKQHFLNWCKKQKSKLVFIESAILFTSKFNEIVDSTIFIDAPQEIRIQRASLRDNTTPKAILARINNQKDEELLARTHANYTINNNNNNLIIPQLLSILQNI